MKNLYFYCFVPSLDKKKFLVSDTVLKVTDERPGSGAGSGAGSVSQRYGSADPESYANQNVTDPEHW
jgi:hypothetical protein